MTAFSKSYQGWQQRKLQSFALLAEDKEITTELYDGNPPLSSGFPAHRVSNAESVSIVWQHNVTWWRHEMETFSALLAISAGNSPVPGEFPAQRPVMRSFDVLFDLRLNKRLSKQSWGWWFQTPSHPLWCQCNGNAAVEAILPPILHPFISIPEPQCLIGNDGSGQTPEYHSGLDV